MSQLQSKCQHFEPTISLWHCPTVRINYNFLQISFCLGDIAETVDDKDTSKSCDTQIWQCALKQATLTCPLVFTHQLIYDTRQVCCLLFSVLFLKIATVIDNMPVGDEKKNWQLNFYFDCISHSRSFMYLAFALITFSDWLWDVLFRSLLICVWSSRDIIVQ